MWDLPSTSPDLFYVLLILYSQNFKLIGEYLEVAQGHAIFATFKNNNGSVEYWQSLGNLAGNAKIQKYQLFIGSKIHLPVIATEQCCLDYSSGSN